MPLRRRDAGCAVPAAPERHSVGEHDAFEVLRPHARDANRRLVDVAVNIVAGHVLLARSRPVNAAAAASNGPNP